MTNDIFSETFDYRNINGGLALHVEQVSRFGTNSLFLFCGEKGLVGIADLNKPEEDPPLSGLTISIADVPYELVDWQILENSDWRLKVAFSVPAEAASSLKITGAIGVQALQPLGTFFGFSGEPRDRKVSEIAANCSSAFGGSQSTTDLFYDTDINGGDLTAEGYRQTTLPQCEEICRSLSQCVAFSFVIDKSWCWPKANVTSTTTRSGVISARVR